MASKTEVSRPDLRREYCSSCRLSPSSTVGPAEVQLATSEPDSKRCTQAPKEAPRADNWRRPRLVLASSGPELPGLYLRSPSQAGQVRCPVLLPHTQVDRVLETAESRPSLVTALSRRDSTLQLRGRLRVAPETAHCHVSPRSPASHRSRCAMPPSDPAPCRVVPLTNGPPQRVPAPDRVPTTHIRQG